MIALLAAVARAALIALLPRTSIALRMALVTVVAVVAAVIVVVARVTALVAVTAWLGLLRWLRRTLPGDFLHGPLKAAQLLVEGFDLALVGRLLPFRFLEQFEQFVELIEGFAQGTDDIHHLVDGLANGGRLGGAEWARRRRWRRVTFVARRFRSLLGLADGGLGGLVVGIGRVGEVTFLVRWLDRVGIIIRTGVQFAFVRRGAVFASVNGGFGRKLFVFVVGSSRVGGRVTGGVGAWPPAGTATPATTAAGATTTSGGRALGGGARRR